jgi:hypothetical protein
MQCPVCHQDGLRKGVVNFQQITTLNDKSTREMLKKLYNLEAQVGDIIVTINCPHCGISYWHMKKIELVQ